MRPHYIAITASCFSALAKLKHFKDCIPSDPRLLLVKSLVFPRLEYCEALLYGLSAEMTTKLGQCKNAALRFVENMHKSEHIPPVYRKHDIRSFCSRVLYCMLSSFACVLKAGVPTYLANRFAFKTTLSDSVCSRRSNINELFIPKASLDMFKTLFIVAADRKWNRLPVGLRMSFSELSFKQKLWTLLSHAIAGYTTLGL
ncbi:uncharacterized protein LOC106639232 [Copidosoma floridanum]|uniref:uncharacterized protein LOC106639232 n=1 Tax=Copidosoma floridanum TaxID=29053 RepID=UPI0006C95D9D|nr:uncharacterized protein LOC106639232 [Copidosoma floridanum]